MDTIRSIPCTAAALYCLTSNPVLQGCTLARNYGLCGGGIFCRTTSVPVIYNSILYSNHQDAINIPDAQISYSNIEGGYSGEGVIDVDPFFIDALNCDYRLSQEMSGQPVTSGCVDAGSGLAAEVCYDTQIGQICMDRLTTRTDNAFDDHWMDMGCHYTRPESYPTPHVCSSGLEVTNIQ